jgi:hypothetical protein
LCREGAATLRESGATCEEAIARAGTAIVLSAERNANPTLRAVKTAARLTMKRITILRCTVFM